MRIVDFNRVKYAVGLEWTLLSNKKKEQVQQLQAFKKARPKSKAYILQASEVGVAFTEQDVPSAAALLCWMSSDASKKSGNPETWVVVEKISEENGEDFYWLCVASEGVVVPGMDVVGNYQSISETLAEVVDLLDGATVYTTDSNFEAYISEVVGVNKQPFADLAKLAPKAAHTAAKPKAYAYEQSLVLTIITVLIVGGLSTGGWMYYKSYQKKELAKRVAAQNRGKSPDEILRDNKKLSDQKTDSNRRALIGAEAQKQVVLFRDALPVWKDTFEKLDPIKGGWVATEISCTIVPAECITSWKRGPLATVKTLLAIAPDAVVDNSSYSTATIRIPVDYKRVSKPDTLIAGGDWHQLFEVEFISNMQSLLNKPFTYTITAPVALSYDSVIVEGADSRTSKGTKVGLGVSAGGITFAGPKFWIADSVLAEANMSWIYADSFKLAFTPVATSIWEIKTKFWLNNPEGAAQIAATNLPKNTGDKK